MPNIRKELKIEGSNLWYLVGLITTDGCLSSDGRHIDITSKDYAFLQEIKDCLGIGNKIGSKYNYYKNCLGLDRKINLARDCIMSYRG